MSMVSENYSEKDYMWTDECEKLLAEWSEKSSCYRWLHGRSEKSYQKWYYCFSIPVIVLSTLTGAANVGMDSFVPAESKSLASAIVGGVNIFAGIVSTLQNFLKVAELMEAHRIAGVSWGKLQRNIAIELALDPSRRVVQMDFLKICRAEYDRLLQAGPIIDDGIIDQFNKKFKNYEISVPSICNGLDKCNIYKIDPKISPKKDEFIDGIEDIISDEEKNIKPKKHELIIKKVNDNDNDITIKIDENISDTSSFDELNKFTQTQKSIDDNEKDELLVPDKKVNFQDEEDNSLDNEDDSLDDKGDSLNDKNDFLNEIK